MRNNFFLNFVAFIKQRDILDTSLLDIRVPVFTAEMTYHLNFRLQIIILDSQLGESVKHHGFAFVAGSLEMLVDNFVNFCWGFSCFDQVLTELGNNISADTFGCLSNVRDA